MRKSKGFTLIELLAVIVVLAVIALIATPIVLNLVNNARKGAAEASAYAYVKEVETYIMLSQINPNLVKLENGKTYEVSKIKYEEVAFMDLFVDRVYAEENEEEIYLNDLVSLKGDKPVSGKVTIEENSVSEAKFVVKGYNVYCDKKICSANGKSKVEIEEEKELYKEELLNGADPVISGKLIPVTITNDGAVKKADIYSKWYSYENKEWANAVILTDKGKVENDGTIKEESIESYFVWIPRYKYQIFDLGNYETYVEGKPVKSNAKEIQIVFENKETAVSNGDEVGEYLSHPAFQAFDVNGFWVGKFETTGSTDNITVKPGSSSLREQNIKTMFELAYNYNRDNDSHMMKNTEWGAVAYLSHSKYGINKEIRINNDSTKTTGCAATKPALNLYNTVQTNHSEGYYAGCENAYNTNVGVLASTTGNITGIYDMSGNSWEYTAAYMNGIYGSSGFDDTSIALYDNKYFDVYSNSCATTNYNNRILGDATGEIGPSYFYKDTDDAQRYHSAWYNDDAYLVNQNRPWFMRGGSYIGGYMSGIFSFSRHTGEAVGTLSFRLVLVG